MDTIKYPKGAEALLIALQTPNTKDTIGIPVLVWGKPGEGKSSFLEGLSEPQFPVLTLIASIHDPTDFSGLPIMKNDTVQYAIPEWVNNFSDKGDGILFLDELTTAPPAVQAALLRVVLERKVGFHDLPKGVRIVAAANPPDLMTGGWELSPPLRNRFVHLQWELSADIYRDALLNGFPKAKLPVIPKKEHAEKVEKYRILVHGFLSRNPNLLSTSADTDRYGFASPRSWDFATALMASCDILGLSPINGNQKSTVFLELLSGCIGEGASINFIGFMKNLKLPSPEDVLDGREKVEIEKLDESELFILFSGFRKLLSKEVADDLLLQRSGILIPLVNEVIARKRKDIIFPTMRHLAKVEHIVPRLVKTSRAAGKEKQTEIFTFLKGFFSEKGFDDYVKIMG